MVAPSAVSSRAVLIRRARLVPVGARPAPPEPVDLRIRLGRVQQVGVALRPAPDDDLVLDAAGRWAIPGLWDQHVHFGQWVQARTQLDVSGTTHPSEVTSRVAEHLARRVGPRDELVVGTGYRSAAWPVQPSVAELDAVTGGHPVALISGDAHNGWLNSRALALFGVAPRPGALAEAEWFPVLARLTELPESRAGREEGSRQAAAEAAALGVVGLVDMEFTSAYLDWPELAAAGVDRLRVRAAAYPERLEDVIAAGLQTGQPLPGGDGLLTMGPLKIISDGSLNTRTASCWEPYAHAEGFEFPYGRLARSLAELVELLGRARAAGLAVALHAIGDAAATTALDAFAASGAAGGIEHAQLLRREDIPRMARLGVRASVQPAHLLDDRDVTHYYWGDRADRCFPLQSLRRGGVTLALGSDAPVSPLDPWLAMAAAVHRSGDGREPWNPAEALTVEQALAASTDGQGTLAAGSRGDVVLLDADPLQPYDDTAAASQHLRSMRVAATLVAGRLAAGYLT